ncbi:hypothetical protein [Mesorhizobium sp. M0895]|uniref:hypothetical protein n=1 Tax=Mesorhizobium sp. M0895 TaxID=2957019 RepID=UPI00333C96F6
MDMNVESRPKATKKAGGRSRVTNGSKLGADMDGRTIWARRLLDLIELYSSDVGPAESISQMKRSLIRRAACLTVELERAEAGFARLGQADADALNAYQTTANSLRRLIESLSIKAAVKDAAEVQRTIEGTRICEAVVDGFDLTMHAVGVGRDRAMINVARRIAFAVARAKETGEPIPESIAALAVELRLADYADEAAVADQITDQAPGLL